MTDQPGGDDDRPAGPPRIIDHSLSDLRFSKDSALGAAIHRVVHDIESGDDYYAAFDSAVPDD